MNYYDILFARKMAGGQGEITTEGLSVTENGTYTAPEGKAYTPVVVNVPTPEDSYQLKSLPIGAISTITDGSNLPMLSLKVGIEPQQEGSGDPSPTNIRPISGWSAVDVSVSGVNVWDEEWEAGGINHTTGQNTETTGIIRIKNYIMVKGNTNYNFLKKTNGIDFHVHWYDADKNFISYEEVYTNNRINYKVATSPQNAVYMRFNLTAGYGATYNNDISINYPSTDTEYHAYNGATYTFDLDGTRYGGTLDVVSGVLTVDKGYIASYNGETLPSTWISDRDVYVEGTSPTTGAQVVYELATPITYQFTPTAVKSLLGTNNIWADTGDVLEGSYFKEL